MKVANLSSMTGGWFIGNFDPSLFKTNDCEVAVKSYKKGDQEGKHYQKEATEKTAKNQRKVRMFDQIFSAGDIVVVEPGDVTSFEALEDRINVVVKMPGQNNDKYLVEE